MFGVVDRWVATKGRSCSTDSQAHVLCVPRGPFASACQASALVHFQWAHSTMPTLIYSPIPDLQIRSTSNAAASEFFLCIFVP